MTAAKILAVCVSETTGTVKTPVDSAMLVVEHGIRGDAHAGTGRQVSLLCESSVDRMREKGLDAKPGIFAENLLISGISVADVRLGQVWTLDSGAVLEISKIGKECHTGCAIRKLVGDCVMPREGFFARVVKGGEVKPGNDLRLTKAQ